MSSPSLLASIRWQPLQPTSGQPSPYRPSVCIRLGHLVEGLWSPVSGNPTLRLLLSGIRCSQASFPPRRYKQTITPRILARLLKSARDSRSLQQQDRQMFQAAMSLAFFGFLRVGEFTATPLHPTLLSRGDIQLVEHILQIRVRRSKADQWGKGSLISIGCSGDKCGPVRAMEQYLKRACLPDSAPLFQFKNGSLLTAKAFRALLHSHLVKMGANPRWYNTHRFHIGAATTAAKAGFSATKIMQLGRWRSKAFMFNFPLPTPQLQQRWQGSSLMTYNIHV